MKTGDKIKAFVQVGLMKKPKWIKGECVEAIGEWTGVEIHRVNVSGNTLALGPGLVKSWVPLTFTKKDNDDYFNEECDSFVTENWEYLKSDCISAVQKFFPEVAVKVNEDEKTLSVEDSYGPYITISVGIIERESIARFFEVPAWSVVYWKSIAATRWEPEDVEEVNCGDSQNTLGAAKILVDMLWRFKTEGYWEDLQSQRMEVQW